MPWNKKITYIKTRRKRNISFLTNLSVPFQGPFLKYFFIPFSKGTRLPKRDVVCFFCQFPVKCEVWGIIEINSWHKSIKNKKNTFLFHHPNKILICFPSSSTLQILFENNKSVFFLLFLENRLLNTILLGLRVFYQVKILCVLS